MDKEYIIALIVGFFIILISIGFIIYENSQTERYTLSDYSCEQLKESLVDGLCVVQSTSTMFNFCFELEEVDASLKYRDCSSNINKESKDET
ncbi:hypothetical protein LCGC14_2358640 [marine sediment metagenome]|uniref:Transmembrane protein n=1 Tax=marine sediment metagenome TaxID=412755 RepID=A0A0F9F244_9ZZZZ